MRRLSVISQTLTQPPAMPADGDRYLVAIGATGDWQGQDLAIAAFQDGVWRFCVPQPGWCTYVEASGDILAWNGTTWHPPQAGVPDMVATLGVNATPDTTNRLAVSSPTSLFTDAGSDHRLVINKAGIGDTASIVFQTGFSGRAEFGLAGNDDWQVKVSPDGSAWITALVVDAASGRVSLPASGQREVLFADRTYYVRSDGNDLNNGLTDTPGGAFASIQAACDAVVALDLSVFSASINIGPGTYAEAVELKSYIGAGPVMLTGNPADPSQVIIDTPGTCISADGTVGLYQVEGIQLKGGVECLYVNGGATCTIDKLNFDGTATHMYARAGGTIQAANNGTYAITASSFSTHIRVNLPAAGVVAFANTISLPVGGATCHGEFVFCKRLAAVNLTSSSFINAAGVNGKRYTVLENAVISTGAGGESFLPGTVAGSVASGGLYV